MSNREFFKNCLVNELTATLAVIKAMPNENLNYRPHPNSRSAFEIAEHIIAHALDFSVILTNNKCDECLVMPFKDNEEGSKLLSDFWNKAISIVETMSEDAFEKINVELLVSGKPLLTLPRNAMLWFFLFDIIHHRGQLSSYLRPMGGKNPAVYGYSFDTR